MGTILNSKMKGDGKVVVELLLDYEEALQLQGHMEGVHIFSQHTADIEAKIAGRGKNESTKYFLIPREHRKDVPLTSKTKVNCQRIDTKTRTMFIYMIDKLGL